MKKTVLTFGFAALSLFTSCDSEKNKVIKKQFETDVKENIFDMINASDEKDNIAIKAGVEADHLTKFMQEDEFDALSQWQQDSTAVTKAIDYMTYYYVLDKSYSSQRIEENLEEAKDIIEGYDGYIVPIMNDNNMPRVKLINSKSLTN